MTDSQRFTLSEFDDLLSDLEGNIKQMKDGESEDGETFSDKEEEGLVDSLDDDLDDLLSAELTVDEEEPTEEDILPSHEEIPQIENDDDDDDDLLELLEATELKDDVPSIQEELPKQEPRIMNTPPPVQHHSPPSSRNQSKQHDGNRSRAPGTTNYRLSGPATGNVGGVTSYTMTATDEAGRPVAIEPGKIDAFTTGPDRVQGQLRQAEFGKCTLNFTFRSPGSYSVVIKIDSKPMFNQPLTVQGQQQFSPTGGEEYVFSATGPGLRGATLGRTTYFDITVQNQRGQPAVLNSKDIIVEVVGSQRLFGAVLPQGTGKFRVEYCINSPGTYYIHTRWSGQSVFAEPSKVLVADKASASQSRVVNVPSFVNTGEQCNFVIQAKDGTGADVGTGGDGFEVSCSGPSTPQGLTLRDLNTGKYNVSFVLNVKGTYTFNIQLDGQHISGSPVKIQS